MLEEKNDVVKFLRTLKENNIEYILLRDYKPVENITVSLDVDIYIEKKYKNIVDKILKEQGWYTPKINASKFPHKQYIRLSRQIIQKIDIVYGLYFGKKIYELNKKINVLEGKKVDQQIFVPSETIGALLIVLHVIFDKGNISNKNFELIKKIKIDEITIDIIKIIVEEIQTEGIQNSNNNIEKYKQQLLQNNFLQYSWVREIGKKLRTKINYNFSKLYKMLSKNSLCFIGVDGSGKSTFVKVVQDILSDNFVKTQYMGYKDYEIECLNTKKISKLKKYIFIYINQWYRYLKTRFSKKMIIYDRYVNEAYINSKGIRRKANAILYQYLFPKPHVLIYLYCDTEISLKRKDDISDIEGFKSMKENFDNIYLNNKNVYSINTNDTNQEVAIKKIIDILNDNMLKYLI